MSNEASKLALQIVMKTKAELNSSRFESLYKSLYEWLDI